jgi:DNA-binding PadR family transcriptional regulator
LGELAFHILLALGDGPAHGYAIGKEIEARTDGRMDPTTGALYQALRRLTEDELVEPVAQPEDVGDARRKYFAMTAAGRRAVAAEAKRLEALVGLAREKKLYPVSARG